MLEIPLAHVRKRLTRTRTIIGTFTATMALHDRVAEKREKRKQEKRDGKQNDAIKELEEKISKLENDKGGEGIKSESKDNDKNNDKEQKSRRSKSRARSQSDSGTSSRSISSSRRRRRRDDMRQSKDMLEQTYAKHVSKAGDRYAEGDCAVSRYRFVTSQD